jgi:hypothetical protein
MRILLGLLVIAVMSFGADRVALAKFDGSVPLLCAPIEVVDCEFGGKCFTGNAESVNLPQFVKIDFKEKVLSAVDDASRTTPIVYTERDNGRLIMHGGQNGRGWTILISEETGKLSATISEEGVGFIVFGACTPS